MQPIQQPIQQQPVQQPVQQPIIQKPPQQQPQPQKIELPENWSSVSLPDGRVYYYNIITKGYFFFFFFFFFGSFVGVNIIMLIQKQHGLHQQVPQNHCLNLLLLLHKQQVIFQIVVPQQIWEDISDLKHNNNSNNNNHNSNNNNNNNNKNRSFSNFN